MRSLRKSSAKFWIAIGALSALVLLGIVAWAFQIKVGMGVAGFTDRSFWAVDMANVVAFIGFSYGGAVVSAILLLTGANWRGPLVRMAEGVALVTVVIGAAYILPHLARPERILNIITDANPHSPIFWDAIAITTYAFATVIFFLLPLIPDVAILNGTNSSELSKGKRWFYNFLSKGWVGSLKQREILHKALLAMAILIIPLAVSVHSVLAWAFSLTSRPGWHESIWAPYFVIAALYSGTALVIIVIAAFRKGYRLENYIEPRHFVRLGCIMATLGAVYAYLTFATILPTAYVGENDASNIIYSMLVGKMAFWFWLFVITGIILPIALVAFRRTRNISGMVVASVSVVIAMWIKRMLMFVEGSGYDRLTMSFGNLFQFTWVSISLTVAGVAAIPLLLMLLFRFVPIFSIYEMNELGSERFEPSIGVSVARNPLALFKKFPLRKVRKSGAAGLLLVLAIAGLSIGQADRSYAVPTAENSLVVLAVTSTGPALSVAATVTADGQPLVEVPIHFYISTAMFAKGGENRILFATGTTDSTGVAHAEYLAAENGLVTLEAEYYFDVKDFPSSVGYASTTISGAVTPYVPTPELKLAGVGQILLNTLFAIAILVLVIIIRQVVKVRRSLRA